MENATKALLIAAAILIAIVLISIGVFVLNQGRDAMSSANLSEAQILEFNNYFESYAGHKRGSDVRRLVDRVNMTNLKFYSGGEGALVTLTCEGVTGDNSDGGSYDASKIPTAQWYDITLTKAPKTGLIQKIDIK